MANLTESNRENLVMDGSTGKTYFQHSWWRIALIIVSVLMFILTCVFNGLAGGGPNGIFNQRTGTVSDGNKTEFTPAGWTFSIWGLIYAWQAAWLIYAISRIPRKSSTGYLYITPDTLHYFVFVFYIINLGLNIAWLIIWDRQSFAAAYFVIFLMLVTVAGPLIITHILLQRNRPSYISSNQKADIWLVRALVHNGLAIYATWLFLATLLNFTIWITRIYNRDPQSIVDASTASISIVLVGIIGYFILENFVFYSAMAYTFTPWFVLIFALCGILSANSKRTDVSERNKSYLLALLVICCTLAVVRLVIFAVRYVRRLIPTIQDP